MKRGRFITFAAASLLWLVCSRGPIRPSQSAPLRTAAVHMKVADGQRSMAVAKIRISIWGGNLDTMVSEYGVDSLYRTVIEDTIQVPVGENRVVRVEALDASDNVVYKGREVLHVSESSVPLEFEVLMYEAADRAVGMVGALWGYGPNTCSLYIDFYAVPYSLPSRVGVNAYVLGQFFGEDALVSRSHSNDFRSYKASVPVSNDEKYHCWLTYGGDMASAAIERPDWDFSFKGLRATPKAIALSAIPDFHFSVGQNIFVEWEPVRGASWYFVKLAGSIVYLCTGTKAAATKAGGTWTSGQVNYETAVTSPSATIPLSVYKGHGDFDLSVTAVNGPIPGEGKAGNIQGGVRGFMFAHNFNESDTKVMVQTGLGFDEAYSTYLDGIHKTRAVQEESKPLDVFSGIVRMYKAASNSQDADLSTTAVRIAIVQAVLNEEVVIAEGDVFTDPIDQVESATFNGIAMNVSEGVRYTDHLSSDTTAPGDYVGKPCTLLIDMGNGVSASAVVAVPDSIDSLIVETESETLVVKRNYAQALERSLGSTETVMIRWNKVSDAKGYLVRFSFDGTRAVFTPDTVVADTFVVVPTRYLQTEGNLDIQVIPYAGTHPSEMRPDPNIGTSGSAKVLVSTGFSGLIGYFYTMNTDGATQALRLTIDNNVASHRPSAGFTFGITAYGEVMPFGVVGSEHVMVAFLMNGYSAFYGTPAVGGSGEDEESCPYSSKTTATDPLGSVVSVYANRTNVKPVSAEVIEKTEDRVEVEVTTESEDGAIQIAHHYLWESPNEYVNVTVTVTAKGAALQDVVYKAGCDWDIHDSPGNDDFIRDPLDYYILAHDQSGHYGAIASVERPDYLDINGWADYTRRTTVEEDSSASQNETTGIDGLAIHHFELGDLKAGESKILHLRYYAGHYSDYEENGLALPGSGLQQAKVRRSWPNPVEVFVGDGLPRQ